MFNRSQYIPKLAKKPKTDQYQDQGHDSDDYGSDY